MHDDGATPGAGFGPPPPGGFGPPPPGGFGPPGAPIEPASPQFNPLAKDLKPEQIEMLKEIHEQFSNERTSGLRVMITPEKNQTHDFDLKPKTIISIPPVGK